MQPGWNKFRISALGKIITGRTPPTSNQQYFGDLYPFITPSDMVGEKIIKVTERYLSEMGANYLRNNIIPPRSVAVSCIGWQMGKVSMTCQTCFTNQQINTIIPNENVDTDYLYYSLSTRRDELLSLGSATGVRTPILNKSAFSELFVLLPPLPTQHKIAAILSAYDNLIENNTRRIRILEEMAQMIYREWFVHFRFPGHEGVRMVETDLGLAPEGWEIKKLGDVCHITMGQSPESRFYNEIGEGLPFHQGVTNFGALFPTDKVYCTVENRLALNGDILMSVRAPVGRINIANKTIVIGRGLCSIRSNRGAQVFIYQTLKEKFKEEDTMGGGTIFKAVTKDEVHSITFISPPNQLVTSFESSITPIFSLLEVMTNKNRNLRITRDLLLPKLVSGEIDVTEMDIHTG